MQRISDLEKQYVLEDLSNEFRTSKNGEFTARLEQKFAQVFRAQYAISQVNGTATMHSALAALGVKPGQEVIVPPLTMASTALAVLHNHSIPVFADVDLDTFTLDPDAVLKCLSPNTKAIITVSLYGLSPDYDKLLQICKDHNLFLIEDNAECFLGEYKGRLVGEFGHFASYSFQDSKHMTCGDGGMLTTNDESLADRARKFGVAGYASVGAKKALVTKNDIQDPRYDRHVTFGFNYRMSDVCAAVALGQLERLPELVETRVKVAKLFESALQDCSCLKPQHEPEGYKNSYWTYAVVLNTDRPDIDWYAFRNLFQKNGGNAYYSAWKLTYMEPLFQNEIQNLPRVRQKYQTGLCPHAEFLQPRLIQFKTNYWDLSEAEEQADILRKTFKQYSGSR